MARVSNVHSGEAGSKPAADEKIETAPPLRAKVDTLTVTDELGRSITIKKLGPLFRTRLFKIVGPDNSRNTMLMGMYLMAAGVTHIDEQEYTFPAKEVHLEALLDKLGDEGVDAISKGWIDAGWVKTDEGDPDNIKN